MYVWARLARMALTTKSRGPLRVGDESRIAFRCLPSDIDRNMHLNNARYMMLADVGRIDIFLRSGLLKLCRERGWGPLMGGIQISYVREVRLWRRFEIVSTIDTWRETQAIGRHRFVLDDGRTAAMTLTTAGIYDFANRRFLHVADVMRQLGWDHAPRSLEAWEEAFLASHHTLRQAAKSGI